ncbi:RHS repeat-associated core domain-containing protein [Myxococcus sp. RHSTA-1-4]|uniref:RHS repeat-associated core domain-containing protein n=1 Tax=Myxococcus sp. RHSTA-1-4 TaxID=2874601 RepID=UPI001CBBF9CA|nr:RHS repeat-associated core domain-containing protein [Myxococcus sp. RHSTA-1-4]MBZ4420714.1 DUF6531 domain-containing protein [Myxococcus sp. RHSTA-1-4]
MTRAWAGALAAVFLGSCGEPEQAAKSTAAQPCSPSVVAAVRGGIASAGEWNAEREAQALVPRTLYVPTALEWRGEKSVVEAAKASLRFVQSDGTQLDCAYAVRGGALELDTCDRADALVADVVRAELTVVDAADGAVTACLQAPAQDGLPGAALLDRVEDAHDGVSGGEESSWRPGEPREVQELPRAPGPRLPAMEQVRAPAVTMAEARRFYEQQALEAPMAQALAQPVSDVTELARALRNDVDRIYEYVHDNITFVPTWGLRKSPLAVILDQSGNAFDQANLMVQLLRAAGYTADLVQGEVRLTGTDIEMLFGTKKDNVIPYLVPSGGIPMAYWVDGTGNVPQMDMGHVWVRATGKELGTTYYHFDPARKQASLTTAAVTLATAMGYTQTDFLTAAGGVDGDVVGASLKSFNGTAIRQKLHTYTTNLINHLNASHRFKTLDQALGGRPILSIVGQADLRVTANAKLKPSTTPAIWASVPTTHQPTLRLQLAGIDKTYYAADLGPKRLTLRYGADNKAVLLLDGATVATATTAGTAGGVQSMTVTINEPYAANSGTYADQSGTMSLRVGSGYTYAVMNGWGDTSRATAEHHRNMATASRVAGSTADSEPVLGESLQQLADLWLSERSGSMRLVERATGSFVYAHHMVGVTGQTTAPYVDIPFGAVFTVSKAGGNDSTAFFSSSGFGSAFESTVIEQTQTVQGISTVSLFDVANTAGKTFYEATSANWATIKPKLAALNFDANELANAEAYINAGYRLIIPGEGNLGQGSWVGFTFLGVSSSNTSIGHIINGAKGGFSSATVTSGTTSTGITSTTQSSTTSGGISSYQPVSGDPVNIVTGDFVHKAKDLWVGPQDVELAFERSYNSAAYLRDGVLGRGWGHNLDIRIREDSDGFQGLGEDSTADAAAMVVGLYVSHDLLASSKGLKNLVLATLAQEWATQALVDNSVTMTSAGANQQFIKAPNGLDAGGALLYRYLPPPGTASTLTKPANWQLTTKTQDVMAFNADGTLATLRNPNGVGLTFTYTSGLLSSVTHTYGWSLAFTYTSGRLTRVADAAGRGVDFTYTGSDLTAVRDPRLNSTTYGYVSAGRLQRIFYPTAPTAAFVTNTYDSLGRVKEQLDANSKLTQYFVAGSRTEEVNPLGHSKTWYFDANGQVLRFINPLGRVTTYAYDGQQNLVSTRTPGGNETVQTYDARYNVIETRLKPNTGTGDIVTTASFHTTWNKPAWTKDARGNQTSFTYDTKGNLTQRTEPLVDGVQPTWTWTYNTRGQVTQETDATSRVITYVYDEAGKKTLLQKKVDPAGLNLVTEYTYTAAGDVATVKDPRGSTTTYAYNANRQRERETLPVPATGLAAPVTEHTYDALGRLTETRRQLGTQWLRQARAYTATDKLASVSVWAYTVDATTPRTLNAYDDAGRLLSVTDPEGRVTRYQRYADGKEQYVYKAYGTASQVTQATYTYNADALPLTLTDARGNKTTNEYDAYGRLKRSYQPHPTTPGTSSTTDYEELGYDADGNITSRRTRAGQLFTYTYDALGRQRQQTGGGLPNIGYDFDAAGRPSRTRYEDGTHVISYTYDTAGRMSQTSDVVGTWTRNIGFTYNAAGNLARLTWPDNYYVTYDYDAANRLTAVKESGTTSLVTLGYDQLSRRTSMVRGGATTSYAYTQRGLVHTITHDVAGTADDVTLTYGYNKANQLTGAFSTNAAYVHVPGAVTTEAFTSNGLNQYTAWKGQAQAHDTNGNVTSSNGRTFAHDALNRLASSTQGTTTTTYTFDPTGRQVKKSVGTTVSQVLYAGLAELGDYNGSNALIRRYIPGPAMDETLAIIEGTAKKYLLTDRLGSVIGVTDAAGTVTEKFSYDPFGESSQALCQATTAGCTPLRWLGRRHQAESGLVDLRARAYAPWLGRFVQTDPIGTKDDVNLYAYVRNDPLNLIDPLGTEAKSSGGLFSSSTWDKIQLGLTGAGFIPGLGIVADVANAGISAVRGNYLDAALSLGAAVPIVGDIAAGARVANNAPRVFWAGGNVAETAAQGLANRIGGVTLDMTAQGRATAQQTANLPWDQARPLWLNTSVDFASGAKGPAHVVHNSAGVSTSAIWRDEYKTLLNNPSVTSIEFWVTNPNGGALQHVHSMKLR